MGIQDGLDIIVKCLGKTNVTTASLKKKRKATEKQRVANEVEVEGARKALISEFEQSCVESELRFPNGRKPDAVLIDLSALVYQLKPSDPESEPPGGPLTLERLAELAAKRVDDMMKQLAAPEVLASISGGRRAYVCLMADGKKVSRAKQGEQEARDRSAAAQLISTIRDLKNDGKEVVEAATIRERLMKLRDDGQVGLPGDTNLGANWTVCLLHDRDNRQELMRYLVEHIRSKLDVPEHVVLEVFTKQGMFVKRWVPVERTESTETEARVQTETPDWMKGWEWGESDRGLFAACARFYEAEGRSSGVPTRPSLVADSDIDSLNILFESQDTDSVLDVPFLYVNRTFGFLGQKVVIVQHMRSRSSGKVADVAGAGADAGSPVAAAGAGSPVAAAGAAKDLAKDPRLYQQVYFNVTECYNYMLSFFEGDRYDEITKVVNCVGLLALNGCDYVNRLKGVTGETLFATADVMMKEGSGVLFGFAYDSHNGENILRSYVNEGVARLFPGRAEAADRASSIGKKRLKEIVFADLILAARNATYVIDMVANYRNDTETGKLIYNPDCAEVVKDWFSRRNIPFTSAKAGEKYSHHRYGWFRCNGQYKRVVDRKTDDESDEENEVAEGVRVPVDRVADQVVARAHVSPVRMSVVRGPGTPPQSSPSRKRVGEAVPESAAPAPLQRQRTADGASVSAPLRVTGLTPTVEKTLVIPQLETREPTREQLEAAGIIDPLRRGAMNPAQRDQPQFDYGTDGL